MTGMSGVGKSTALAELAKRGFQVVETDDAPWSEWSDAEGGYVWREDVISELLSRDVRSALYVSGTVSNQGRFLTEPASWLTARSALWPPGPLTDAASGLEVRSSTAPASLALHSPLCSERHFGLDAPWRGLREQVGRPHEPTA